MNEESIMGEFNQNEYIKQYHKEFYRNFAFKVRKDNTELIDWLDSQPNKTEYLMSLIEEDMKKNKHLD